MRFAEIIARLTQALVTDLVDRHVQKGESGPYFLVEIQTALSVVRKLASHLRLVERSTTRRTPWSLIEPLERLGREIHPDAEFIIRPQWIYNYSISDYLAAYKKYFENVLAPDVLEAALTLDGSFKVSSLYIVTFPFMERLNVLLHTLIGHELGHPIEKGFFLTPEDIKRQSDLLNAVKAEALKLVKDPTDLFEVAEVTTTLYRRAVEMRNRALAELACDIVCQAIFGPAAAFAIEEFAKSEALDVFDLGVTSRFYPPWRYRLRVVFESFPQGWLQSYLTAGQFDPAVTKCVNDKWSEIEAIVADKSDETVLRSDPAANIAYTSVESTLPELRSHVAKWLDPAGFKYDRSTGSCNSKLLERLDHWVPPDAYLDASGSEVCSDMFAILNVAWIRYLCILSQGVTTGTYSRDEVEDYATKLDTLWRLVLKAIEFTELRKFWTARGGAP